MSGRSAAGANAPFTVEKIPIYSRDDGPSKLFGWTWSEMLMLAGAAVVANLLFHRRLVTVAALAAMYLYIRKVKQYLPERFVTNLARHHVRRDLVYRAAGRDTQWRPPVIPDVTRRWAWPRS